MLVEVLIMAPASGPHRAGRIPRGDTAGMNPPGPALLLREDAGAGSGPGTGGDPNADPAARAAVALVRTATDLCDRADALREIVT